MATKGQKKRDLNIDEEKDAFLLSINKKIRNNNKKLDQIRDLEKKEKSTLLPEQIQKIQSRPEVLKNTQYFEGIKDLYYEALKASKDEQKTETTEVKTEVAPQQTITQTVQPQVVQTVNIGETTQRILNLVHFAQIYTDARKRDELKSHVDKSDGLDFDTVYEFYAKIFTFSESDKFDKLGTKISNANHELESYLNRAETVALRNQSYRHLNDVVEKIAASSHFRDQKADISAAKITTSSQISAIGSELKKEAPVEEVRAPEPKSESPVKTHEKEIPTVEEVERQQQQEAQKEKQQHHEKEQKHHHKQQHHGKQHHHQAEKTANTNAGQVAWADIDDEKEETKQEEAPKTQSNQDDDGFITVTKRTPTTTNQRGGRGSGRGNGRGNGRGSGRGGFKRNGEGRPERNDDGEKREGGDNKEHREYKPKRDNRTAGGERQYVPKTSQNASTGDNNAQ